MTSLSVGGCRYSTDGALYSEVVLPDGRVIPSAPQPTAQYEATARELGYDDGASLAREHDFLHAFLAGIFGATSPTLVDVADGTTRDHWMEEELVKLVAIRLNDSGADALPGGGLLSRLRTLLRPTPVREAT